MKIRYARNSVPCIGRGVLDDVVLTFHHRHCHHRYHQHHNCKYCFRGCNRFVVANSHHEYGNECYDFKKRCLVRVSKRDMELCSLPPAPSRPEAPPESPETQYTIRIKTGSERDDGLSEWQAGIQLTIIGSTGNISHTMASQKTTVDEDSKITVIDNRAPTGLEKDTGEEGPKRKEEIKSQQQSIKKDSVEEKSAYISYLFDRGSEAYDIIQSPSIGTLEEVWIGPVAGKWRPEIVEVESRESVGFPDAVSAIAQNAVGNVDKKDSNNVDGNWKHTFRMDSLLDADDSWSSYAVLKPGESRYQLSPYGDNNTHGRRIKPVAVSLEEYRMLKGRLFGTTSALTAVGGAISLYAFGLDNAIAFATGGFSGLIYLFLLSLSVDNLGDTIGIRNISNDIVDERLVLISKMVGIISSQPFRLGFVALMLSYIGMKNDAGATKEQLTLLGLAILGFLMYRFAVVLVTSMSPQIKTEAGEKLSDEADGANSD